MQADSYNKQNFTELWKKKNSKRVVQQKKETAR